MGRKAAVKVNETSVKLLKALAFISMAQKDIGAPSHTHCQFYNGRLCATDGVSTVGCMVDETIDANPHTHKLIAALKHCGLVLKITQAVDSLAIISGSFRATVPCMPPDVFDPIGPDAPTGSLDERLRDAFRAVGPLATEGAPTVLCASVLLGPGYAVATNRHAMFQFIHRLNTPPNVLLPKTFVAAILKIDKPLKSFGYSPTTFTIWFDDDSFIKTQLYAEVWPNWEAVIGVASNQVAVPAGIEDAVKAVESWCEHDAIYLTKNVVESHTDTGGAKYELRDKALALSVGVNVEWLKLMLPYAVTADWGDGQKSIVWYGENVRGVICPIVRK